MDDEMSSKKSPHLDHIQDKGDRIVKIVKRSGDTDVTRISNLLAVTRGTARDYLDKLVEEKRLTVSNRGFNKSLLYSLPKT